MRFHHIGVACADLEVERAAYRLLGYEAEGEEFVDHAQGVRGRFLVGGGPRLELLVALPARDVLAPWTARGVRMYHVAYETPSLDDTVETLLRSGARLVSEPTPAVAFGGRPVAFVALRTMQLVELVQAEAAPVAGER